MLCAYQCKSAHWPFFFHLVNETKNLALFKNEIQIYIYIFLNSHIKKGRKERKNSTYLAHGLCWRDSPCFQGFLYNLLTSKVLLFKFSFSYN